MSHTLLTVVAAAAIAPPLAAQPHAGVHVVRLGRDTVAVERFSRSGENEFQGEQAIASPPARTRCGRAWSARGGR